MYLPALVALGLRNKPIACVSKPLLSSWKIWLK